MDSARYFYKTGTRWLRESGPPGRVYNTTQEGHHRDTLIDGDGMMDKREIIICDGEVSRNAHRELFRADDWVYLTVPSGHDAGEGCPDFFAVTEDFIEVCRSSQLHAPKAQFVLTWENLLRLCLWKNDRLLPGEVLKLLEDAGMHVDELDALRNVSVGEIFRSIYYGKRFEILRRLCHFARKQIEDRLSDSKADVVCHVVAEETKRIVASSL